MFVQGVPRYSAEGSFVGYIGSAVDVSDRKEAETALSTLSQRLIQAQEQERGRLARELHDDINQRLTLLVLNLEAAKQRREASPSELRAEIDKAIDAVKVLSTDVQDLSRRLHSSRLNILGLEAAARQLCRELSDRLTVDIRFQSMGAVRTLPEDMSVALYRVLQEALQNAIKHSGSQRIDVWLRDSGREIALTVRDSGVGFEPNKALNGLGLISMRERLKAVDGELTIDARPGVGTAIRTRVPLNPK
jgi:signal transduction histidine kinase